jgi:hypothetical protein
MSDRMKPKLTPQERARKWLRPPRVFVTAYVALSLIVHFSLKAYVTVHLARDVRTTQPISAPEVVEEWSPVLKSISDIATINNTDYFLYRGILHIPAGTEVYRARSAAGHDYLCMSGPRRVCAPLFRYSEGSFINKTYVAHDGDVDELVRFFHNRWTATPYFYPIGFMLGV